MLDPGRRRRSGRHDPVVVDGQGHRGRWSQRVLRALEDELPIQALVGLPLGDDAIGINR